MPKILCITCDNASCNNRMVKELEFMLEDYVGEVGHAHCFLHIVSIIAKTIIKQFDVRRRVMIQSTSLTKSSTSSLKGSRRRRRRRRRQ